MRNRVLFVFMLLLVVGVGFSQVNYTANNQVTPYAGAYRAGVNPGYYGGNWNNFDLTDLSAGNAALNIKGAGVRAIRGTLPESLGLDWGYDSWVPMYEYYDALGVKDNTLVVGVAHPDHRDPVDYCPDDPVQSEMFANLYEPIWDGGANGTPVNDNNYMAKYVYDLVTTVGDHVKFWEVWNEPGFDLTHSKSGLQPGQPGNWYENDPDPCDIILRAPIQHYIRTLRITYEVVKTLSPDDYVVLSGIGTDAFLDALMRNTDNPNGGQVTPEFPYKSGAYFDVVGFHAYPSIDGSTKHWDNNTQQMVYTRHSDGAIEGFDNRVEQRKNLLAGYGYDGITYPKKLLIATEMDVPRLPFGDAFGSDELQKNYIMKAVADATRIGLLQTHVWQLAERTTAAEATGSFDVMGFYKNINNTTPGNEEILPQGIAHSTAAKLLEGTTFSQAETDALNLPQGVKGGAFQRPDGSFVYMLWARTQTDMSEEASATYSFPASYGASMMARYWDFSETNATATISSQNINLTGTPIFFTHPENVGSLTLNCPAGAAIYVPAPESDGGAVVTWTEPTASTTCPGGVSLTNSGGASGDFFPFGNTVVSYTATDECGNTKHCATRISVGSTGGVNATCHTSLWGFYFIGQMDGHKYFASADQYTYQEAVAKAASYGGKLLSIETQKENDFFLYKFGDVAYIGLSDATSEGNLEWASGAPVDFMAPIESCTWCQANNETNDFAMYHPWNANWSFTDGTVPHSFILELDCAALSGASNLTINSFPANIQEQAASGMNVSWDEPTAGTTCSDGIVNINQIAGPDNGSYFAATGEPVTITYSFSDNCDNTSTLSFTVTVNPQNVNTGNCPDNISGFTFLGEYNGHKYFLSEDENTWLENNNMAQANGGYLLQIDDADENSFIQNHISEMVHIGLTDRQSEGNLVWDHDGQSPVYSNLSDCDWCGLNDAAHDYGLMLFWDGKWSFDKVNVARKMIMELDCQATNNTSLTVTCPDDIHVNAGGGTVVTWVEPTATTSCNPDNIHITQVAGPANGSYFSVDNQPVMISYSINDDCGNQEECNFNVTVEPAFSGCPNSYPDFTLLGQYNGHKYFVSSVERTWLENESLAETNGGYLAVINDAAENTFLKDNISEMLHIGLNDQGSEGNLEWINGNALAYSNLSDCDWCGLNDSQRDFGLIDFWDGKWSFDTEVIKRKMIMEVDCQTSDLVVSCPDDILLEASGATIVTWNEPTAATTCSNSDITITQTAGPVNGSYFEPDNMPVTITYVLTDACGNSETCSFTVTVSNSNISCPTSLAGYQFLGTFGGHNYFVSDNKESWSAASQLAVAVGGQLAIINSEAENEFLRTHINSYSFIGLSDANVEGELVWQDGNNLTINKLEDGNDQDRDYAMMNFWNGNWSLVNQWVEKNYIVELSCSSSQPTPLMASAKMELPKTLYPNPAEDILFLEMISLEEQPVTFAIYDVLGKEVLHQEKLMQKGMETIQFDVHNLESGVYYLRLSSGEVLQFMKN